MNYWKRISLWVIIVLLLVMASGCQEKKNPSVQPTTLPVATEEVEPPEPTEDPVQRELADKYMAAVEASFGDSYALSVQYESSVTVAGQTYQESHDMTLDFRNVGSDTFLGKVKDSVTYGNKSYDAQYQEIYSDGKVYQKIEDGKFYAEQSAEEFVDRYAPAQMLTPELYTLSDAADHSIITFEGASAGENWAFPDEDAELISASGTAELGEDGKLLKTTYTASFRYGMAEYTVSYEAVPEELGREPSVPGNTEEYVLMEHIEGTVMLEHFYGYLSQLRHGAVQSHDLVMSVAAGCYIQQNISLDAYAKGLEYAAKSETSFHMEFADEESESVELVEKMIDGKYTYTIDGGKEMSSSLMTQERFEGEVTDTMSELIYGSEYVSSMEITLLGDVILLEFVGNEEMGEMLCRDVNRMLFDDSDLLDSFASDYYTDKMEFYVAMDRFSLLPTAMGVEYEGIHVIDGYDLPLIRQVDRSFDMASLSSYEAIFEDTEPEEEPENPATPLFYRVTGPDGQEMWLLGTIHIGDARTGYLPEEIYDALYASDALAVECDIDTFYETVDEDEELQEQISALYVYEDGSTVEEHIDTPELYEDAKKLMKATGNYFHSSDYMTAYIWSNAIEQFYFQAGHNLTSEKGVDNRLLKIAKEEEIPVWEVESTMFQMEMTANYSDHLQELMLYQAVASGILSYCESSEELYELWCAGDEAALIAKICEEDDWSISEEDIDLTGLEGEELERAQAVLADLDNINARLADLQEEYNSSMSIDRNAGMLEVAVEYLESDNVVFFAVGLAHLLEEDGLVNTLRDAGYTVELVSYQ